MPTIQTTVKKTINRVNKAAQALGRRAKGVPKKYSPAELEIRKQRLAAARAKRWPVEKNNHANE